MHTSLSANSTRILRDLANGLQQQMFFWGQDILHPEGNILVKQGFQRSPSTGLEGHKFISRLSPIPDLYIHHYK